MKAPLAQADWRKVRAHADARIAEHQRRLETNLSEADTAMLRGRIAELRALIAWGEPADTDAEPLAAPVGY